MDKEIKRSIILPTLYEFYYKDIKRFSFSRFKTFQTCPRKHNYIYVEQIETEEYKVNDISMNEKRIYAPNIVAVVDAVARYERSVFRMQRGI